MVFGSPLVVLWSLELSSETPAATPESIAETPYRRALAHNSAVAMIYGRKGTMYDPRIVDAFWVLHGVEPGVTVVTEAERREKSVVVSPATTRLEFRYEPASFRIGLALAAAASAILALAAFRSPIMTKTGTPPT